MDKRELIQHIYELGLGNPKLQVDIDVHDMTMLIWNTTYYVTAGTELAGRIKSATEFDYKFYCMLVNALGMDVLDALELSLS